MLDYNLETLCLGKGSLLKSEKVFPCVRMLVTGHREGDAHCSSLLLQAGVTLCQVLHTDLKARLIFFFFSVSFVVVEFCFGTVFETGSLARLVFNSLNAKMTSHF